MKAFLPSRRGSYKSAHFWGLREGKHSDSGGGVALYLSSCLQGGSMYYPWWGQQRASEPLLTHQRSEIKTGGTLPDRGHLINPAHIILIARSSTSHCEGFSIYFTDKIAQSKPASLSPRNAIKKRTAKNPLLEPCSLSLQGPPGQCPISSPSRGSVLYLYKKGGRGIGDIVGPSQMPSGIQSAVFKQGRSFLLLGFALYSFKTSV